MSTILNAPHVSAIERIGALPLQHGGTLVDVDVAFEAAGDPEAPAVVVLGGISAGRGLLPARGQPGRGWWPGVVGAGCVLDPERYRLIGIDYVGGRGDSSRPGPGEAWPALTTRDQADALIALLDAIDIDSLHAIVGASYGGMVGLALAARQPERVGRVVALCAAHRPHPMATAIRSVQRRIVRLAAEAGTAADGVGIARALAMTTYRTSAEFRTRFREPPHVNGRARFDIDSYLDRHAHDYACSFPSECFLTLSESLDLHSVDPAAITVPCSLIHFESDTLVPPDDVRKLADALPVRASLTSIPTMYGHDGFLKEARLVSAAIRRALDAVVTPTAGATAAVRAGIVSDTQFGAVIPPIHLSTTFSFSDFGVKRAYDYTRSGNPTRDVLGNAIAQLERGTAGVITSTGMSAIATVLQLLRPGDVLIAAHDGYGGTYRIMQALAARQAFDVRFVDLTQPGAADVIRSTAPRMVWIETPSNPLLRITDIAAIASVAHDVDALCIADNTFLSPALQTPIDLGADIVVHSTTKYLNGHSDVVGGAIVARDPALAEELGWWANCTGATGSPFDSYLTLRGVRTLHARMRVHEENAAAVVDLLYGHPAVRTVYYPGLRTHPGHEIAARQQRGFGAMVSFELSGGENATRRFLAGLRCFTLAESLGGVESLIAHPATMTHAAMDADARRTAGIGDGLLRLSVGIEAAADLVRDLSCALDDV